MHVVLPCSCSFGMFFKPNTWHLSWWIAKNISNVASVEFTWNPFQADAECICSAIEKWWCPLFVSLFGMQHATILLISVNLYLEPQRYVVAGYIFYNHIKGLMLFTQWQLQSCKCFLGASLGHTIPSVPKFLFVKEKVVKGYMVLL